MMFWHKPTGVAVTEATKIELVRLGRFGEDEFERCIELTESLSIELRASLSGRGTVLRQVQRAGRL